MQHIHGRTSSKGMSYLIAGILVLLAFHAFLTVWLSSKIGHYTELRLWKEALLLACTLPVAWIVLRNPAIFTQVRKNRMMQLIAAYVALQIMTGIIAYVQGDVGTKALGYAWISNTRFLLFFLLCAFVANRSDWLRMHWRTILLVPSIIVILFGLAQFFVLPGDFLKHVGYGPETIPVQSLIDNKEDYLRIQSTQRGANPFGAYLVIVLTALTVLIATRNHIRFWRVVLLVLGSGALLLTFSRSAWLGMMVAGTVGVLLCAKTKKQKRVVYMVLAGLIVAAGVGLFTLRSTATFQNAVFHTDDASLSSESSNAAHASAKMDALKEVITAPLGDGPGTAGPASVYNSEQPARVAENYFLQIGQEVGWLGVVLFILILFGLARGWWRERDATLNRVMLATLFGLIVVNMLWHGWADDTVAYVWWGLAGIAYGSQIARQQERIAREQMHEDIPTQA